MIKASNFKYLHTMIRVINLDASLDFYGRLLGMTLLRKKEFPSGRFTLAFMGYGEEHDNTVIELTYNWDQKTPYEHGTAFGHLALGVSNVDEVCKMLEGEGVNIPRPPGPMKHGGSLIAFIEDPDGYKIELIERT